MAVLNILGPVSMDNFVAMGAGERGEGVVRVLIEMPGEGTIQWSPFFIDRNSL